MIPLAPIFRIVAAFAFAVTFVPSVRAQDAVPAELKALRQLVEQQSKQIDNLTVQVAKIQARLDAGADPAAPVVSTTPAAQPVEKAEFSAPAAPPKPANVHIVVKGESLDKIARTHNTTAAEIQKLNRIAQPKKLQIGQQLVLPVTTPKKEPQ